MKLRASVIALALVSILAACGQSNTASSTATTSEELTPANLQIDIGRTGAMLGNVRAITEDLPAGVETDPTALRELARALRETVWEYNLERSRLCGKGLYTAVSCGPAYEPVWIAEAADSEPTLEILNERAEGLRAEVSRFEGAICDDARSKVPENERMAVCPME
ncbi:hypothetical protein [Terricaulis sp.]|uniref:hypothetical protein n=1 Tax=Terricaulis sp. TaxID=2768686 RepID=UPI0037838B22